MTSLVQELGSHMLTNPPIFSENELVTVGDPEVGRANPSENKQLKLARVDRAVFDRDLKPNSSEKKYVFLSCLLYSRFACYLYATIDGS